MKSRKKAGNQSTSSNIYELVCVSPDLDEGSVLEVCVAVLAAALDAVEGFVGLFVKLLERTAVVGRNGHAYGGVDVDVIIRAVMLGHDALDDLLDAVRHVFSRAGVLEKDDELVAADAHDNVRSF